MGRTPRTPAGGSSRSGADPFDSEAFRAEGHRLVDHLADYLRAALRGDEMAVLPFTDPEAALARWPALFPPEGGADLVGLLDRVLVDANHVHHPHYVGHQVTAPLPGAALADFAAALLNNGMAVYEMGMSATAMERRVTDWMCGLLGFPAGAGGVLTHGGSLGNLTALLAARQARAGFDLWQEGAHAGPPLAVLVSDQAHYSVQRAVQVMGWGAGGAVSIPSDARRRMRPHALPDGLRRAEHTGRKVVGVIASSGSTATGSFDPLGPIADFCAAEGLWLHVDAAHGGAVALSSRFRHLLEGIERADSVVWDAHKMMLMPALVTGVLFRDNRRSYEAFAQEASYLFHGGKAPWWDVGARTIECTKRMLGVKLYTALQVHGTDFFARYIESRLDLASRFAARLRATRDFEVPVDPQCNIVCFRYAPPGGTDLDQLQERIRRRVIASGAFYLVQTRLREGVHLRTTLINPNTSDEDLDQLIEAVRAAGREE